MGRISRRRLHKDLEERIHQIFWSHLAQLDDPLLIREFLQCLLSDTESIMIAKRLAIAILLSQGYTYSYIDNTLKVSKSTISTVDRQLITGAPGYKRAIEMTKNRKKKEEFGDSIEEFFLGLSFPARFGSARHRLKSEIGKGLYKRKFQRRIL